jgi:hypothetical protein
VRSRLLTAAQRITPRSASVLLLCACIGLGASVMAFLHRDPVQAGIAAVSLSLCWLVVWASTTTREASLQLTGEAMVITASGLRYSIRWDEITAGRLVNVHGQTIIQLRLKDRGRVAREATPRGKRWRLTLRFYLHRTYLRCDLTLNPAHFGLDPIALHEEIRARAALPDRYS